MRMRRLVRAEIKKAKTGEVRRMENTMTNRVKLSDLRTIATNAIKEKGLTEEEVRKTLGMKRYE